MFLVSVEFLGDSQAVGSEWDWQEALPLVQVSVHTKKDMRHRPNGINPTLIGSPAGPSWHEYCGG